MDGCTTEGRNLQSRNPDGGVSRTVDLTPWRRKSLFISKLADRLRSPVNIGAVACLLLFRAPSEHMDAHTPVQRG